MGLVVQTGLQASDYRSKCRRGRYRPGGICTIPSIGGGLRTRDGTGSERRETHVSSSGLCDFRVEMSGAIRATVD
jgi:hypothetical protein